MALATWQTWVAEGWTPDFPLYASFLSRSTVLWSCCSCRKMDPGFSSMCILWVYMRSSCFCRRMDPGFSSICILFSDGCTWGAAAPAEVWVLDSSLYASFLWWVYLRSCCSCEGWTLDSPLYASFSLMGVPEELLLLPKDGHWILLHMHLFSDGCTWGAAVPAEGWALELHQHSICILSLMGVPEELLLLPKDGPWIFLSVLQSRSQSRGAEIKLPLGAGAVITNCGSGSFLFLNDFKKFYRKK